MELNVIRPIYIIMVIFNTLQSIARRNKTKSHHCETSRKSAKCLVRNTIATSMDLGKFTPKSNWSNARLVVSLHRNSIAVLSDLSRNQYHSMCGSKSQSHHVFISQSLTLVIDYCGDFYRLVWIAYCGSLDEYRKSLVAFSLFRFDASRASPITAIPLSRFVITYRCT
ncbi:hypothetical protein HanOQP8_Chr05g0182181 [Helianthus annuus]|nr:hypothetical protein HanOQP8_Chr05g0182181 [Helianthus annuus]